MEAGKIPGIYVPSLYNVTYKEDGTIDSFTPADAVLTDYDRQAGRDGYDRYVLSGQHRLCRSSRPRRIVSYSRSSVDVSVGAVSVRPV